MACASICLRDRRLGLPPRRDAESSNFSHNGDAIPALLLPTEFSNNSDACTPVLRPESSETSPPESSETWNILARPEKTARAPMLEARAPFFKDCVNTPA
jgi:hypothetical protein